jgi:5-deoxy-glucuronate isomerase
MTAVAHPCLVRSPAGGFGWGLTAITRAGEPVLDTGMSFAVLRLRAGESHQPDPSLESACLLLGGDVRFVTEGISSRARRGTVYDEDPSVLHLPPGTAGSVEAITEAELALVQTTGLGHFEPRCFGPGDLLETEHRGRGQLGDAAYRIVRTVFDRRNRPQAALVLGEVVSFPGRWSSYPPHHHPQPEIYHYRFQPGQGYGHAELGEAVLKVRHGDTVKIFDGQDHPQVAAPGYRMYYLWVIRHLPGHPYTVPEFAEEHRWLLGDPPPVTSTTPR